MTQPASDIAPHPFGLLQRRQSVPSRLLGAPGPSDEQLHAWLRVAVRVPDHGKLTPWRFLLIRHDAGLALGELLARTLQQRDPQASDAALAKERGRFANAPLVIAVVGRIIQEHRIPACEQLLSAGCACFSLLLAAQADGFGAQWLTGWAAYDRTVATALGLDDEETIVGFIHVGTPREQLPDRERPTVATLVSEWRG